MKRKLNGLLSLWLAIMMILSSMAVFAEGETTTGTIYVYQKTIPLKDGEYNTSIESIVSDGSFAKIDDFKLNEPITPQLEEAGKLPVAPDGYEANGWRVWAYDSGMSEPMSVSANENNQEVFTSTYYDYGYNFLEALWAVKYSITKQPTADDPSVKVNYSEDVASYQWYEAEPAEDITAKNATAVNGADFETESSASFDAKTGWTGIEIPMLDEFDYVSQYVNYYFTVDLKAGDTIWIYSENELLATTLLDSERNVTKFAIDSISDGVYTITALEDGDQTLATVAKEAGSTIKAKLLPALDKDKIVEDQTNAKLDADKIGTYLCEITFKYNNITTNEPIILYSDRITTIDGPKENQLTVSFDANGGSGTMKNVYVDKYDMYELPECGFDAPDDMLFDCWEINGKEYDPEEEIEIRKDTVVKALWHDEGVVATPEFSPDGGTFRTSALDVKITCDTPRVTIYYTTNGDDPRDSSKRKKYEGNIYIKADTTIKAYAVKDGMEDSEVASAFFDKRATAGSSGGSSSSGSSYGGTTSIKSYTVKFNTKGGLTVADQYISKNKTVKEPEKVTKYGYTFEGWYTDEKYTTKYDFDTPVTKSFTLYAKWSEGEAGGNSSNSAADNRIILTIGKYEMLVFGEEKTMDVVPQIVKDRTMLPARHVAEALGAAVEWNETEPKKVRITKGDIEIIIWIDSDTAYVNGEPVALDSPAFLENDRTYTPVRFICEKLGATVEWEEGEQQVIIIVNN